MTVDEFKQQLAALVQENRNLEAISFATLRLPGLRQYMSAPDRLLVADWMEGVETTLDLGVDHGADQVRS